MEERYKLSALPAEKRGKTQIYMKLETESLIRKNRKTNYPT